MALGAYLEQLFRPATAWRAATLTSPGSELRRLSQRVSETEARLAAIETSTSYRLGPDDRPGHPATDDAARRLPQLAGVRRSRGPSRPPARPTACRRAWIVAPPGMPRSGPGQSDCSRRTARRRKERGPDCASPGRSGTNNCRGARPRHDGPPPDPERRDPRCRAADPDLLLIETGAFGAGRQWAYGGNPAATDRDRELLRLIDSAEGWDGRRCCGALPPRRSRSGSAHRRPIRRRARCRRRRDVGRWLPGVQLASFNLLGADERRSDVPTLVGTWDVRAPRKVRQAQQELLEGFLLTASRSTSISIRRRR